MRYFEKIVARRGARLAAEERGAAKRRGRGLGQRNTKFLKKRTKFKKNKKLRQSPFARKASFNTGRAGPLACAAAADHLRP